MEPPVSARLFSLSENLSPIYIKIIEVMCLYLLKFCKRTIWLHFPSFGAVRFEIQSDLGSYQQRGQHVIHSRGVSLAAAVCCVTVAADRPPAADCCDSNAQDSSLRNHSLRLLSTRGKPIPAKEVRSFPSLPPHLHHHVETWSRWSLECLESWEGHL